MIQRTVLTSAALTASAALLLSGCTGGDSPKASEQPSSPAAESSAAETPDPESEDQTAYGKLVDGFPTVIEPLPEAEIVSSTLSPDHAPDEPVEEGEEKPAATPGTAQDGSERVGVALVLMSTKPEKEILDFYTKSLEKHGFQPVGDSTKEGDVTTQAFHDKAKDQSLSLSVGPAPEHEKDTRQVTIGGVVVR